MTLIDNGLMEFQGKKQNIWIFHGKKISFRMATVNHDWQAMLLENRDLCMLYAFVLFHNVYCTIEPIIL